MQDFNEYANSLKNKNSSGNGGTPNGNMDKQGIMDMVSALASRYDGKNTSELIKAVYVQAKKGKANGTLTNADLDNFASMLSPILDDKKRKALYKIVNELKEI